MKNLIKLVSLPEDYRGYRILVKVDGFYYLANKLGSRWNLGRLEGGRVVEYDQIPPAPSILMEYGESLTYDKYIRVLSDVTRADVVKFLKNMEKVIGGVKQKAKSA